MTFYPLNNAKSTGYARAVLLLYKDHRHDCLLSIFITNFSQICSILSSGLSFQGHFWVWHNSMQAGVCFSKQVNKSTVTFEW